MLNLRGTQRLWWQMKLTPIKALSSLTIQVLHSQAVSRLLTLPVALWCLLFSWSLVCLCPMKNLALVVRLFPLASINSNLLCSQHIACLRKSIKGYNYSHQGNLLLVSKPQPLIDLQLTVLATERQPLSPACAPWGENSPERKWYACYPFRNRSQSSESKRRKNSKICLLYGLKR